MNIDLREEQTIEYISFYQSYLEEIQLLNNKVTGVLNEIMQQSRYDKLQRRISDIIDAYTDRIINDIEGGVFAAWEDSAGSLRSCVRTYMAGDKADAVCAQIERQMDDLMREILKIDKADMVVTERPVVSEDGLEQLEEICRSAQTQIQDIKSDYLSKAMSKEDENEIYGTLRPLFEGVSANMEAFFEASFNSFVELHEFVKEISVQLHNIVDENSAAADGKPEEKPEEKLVEKPDEKSKEKPDGKLEEKPEGRAVEDEGDLDFSGDNFNEDNLKLVVVVIEKIVNQAGVDELNASVDKHYTALSDNRKIYAKRPEKGSSSANKGSSSTNKGSASTNKGSASTNKGSASTNKGSSSANKGSSSTNNVSKNIYGRYTVTDKSLQQMAPLCAEVNSVLESIDKFYKERFEALGKGFDKANSVIHEISTFLGQWGAGTLDLSKTIKTEDSDKAILDKILADPLELVKQSKMGKIINGGAQMLKIMDQVMPHIKKSKILVKLSEKFWNLTRQDIQNPYLYNWIDMYMMEHYEIKHGSMKLTERSFFEYFHYVVAKIDDKHQRRTFENSMFAAEIVLFSGYYTVNETDPQKIRAICCGIFLNHVRSGMCSNKDIEPETSNNIVDKLYNVYISEENVTPRVDINPDTKNVV